MHDARRHDHVTENLPHTVEHRFDADTPASVAIVRAISVLENVDPTRAPDELGLVLHDHIEPTALDSLLGSGTGDGDIVVSFEISHENTYAVAASDDGRILVRYDHVASSRPEPPI